MYECCNAPGAKKCDNQIYNKKNLNAANVKQEHSWLVGKFKWIFLHLFLRFSAFVGRFLERLFFGWWKEFNGFIIADHLVANDLIV